MPLNMGTGLVVILPLVMLGTAVQSQEDPKRAHGVFTGEIKSVLYVSDVEKSAPYYRDVLGFDFQGYAENNDGPYYAEMVAAGIKFGLHEPTTAKQEEKVGQQRLYFRVKDLLVHRARVAAWGGEPGETKTTAWMDMFIVRDLDGSEIVFASTDPDQHSINPWSMKSAGAQGGKEVR